ncbi:MULTISPECIES: VOC family protein [Actinokineospora]|uniref:Glyoxalase n=1 Tax=Actinokineospora fastidiosa TaxID=1816 RepID=A0A918GNJ0_9PSEU|nr:MULTISPECIES: VOC family protein [Actinokineospora]UVS78007.1 27 kDa antigen Cfp30B [Actinokineospora sp. UTMC 2448]GGS50426.1 glyoxalase [Actinokineospora fastidiosa]
MVVRKTAWPAGTPCWVDLGTDVDRAVAFYGGLFGWTFESGGEEFAGYGIASKDGHPVAGIGPRQSPDQPAVWTTYLATEDVAASAEAVVAAGGKLLFEPMAVHDKGSMVIAADPVGAVFGLWQAGTNTGADLANEPGALVWNEHMSADSARAKEFYAKVFDYTYGAVDGMDTYFTINVPNAEQPVGGIGDGDGPGWVVYFQAEDADTTAATVQKLGGSVLAPIEDTPFGRMLTLADDQGTRFHVMANVPEQ